jgi:hypothetical protein
MKKLPKPNKRTPNIEPRRPKHSVDERAVAFDQTKDTGADALALTKEIKKQTREKPRPRAKGKK